MDEINNSRVGILIVSSLITDVFEKNEFEALFKEVYVIKLIESEMEDCTFDFLYPSSFHKSEVENYLPFMLDAVSKGLVCHSPSVKRQIKKERKSY